MRHPRDGGVEEGSVAVEFALTATLLLMLVFGIIAFGIQFGNQIVASQAASEGARAAVAGLNAAERQQRALTAARATLSSYGISAANSPITFPTPANADELDVRVVIDISAYGLSGLGAFVPQAISNNPRATVSVKIGGF